ncbi:hypothetical protein ILFOPFJJ_06667 [Ensifer psoraleae]|nr:hypothetical protein [Sinorhizobium psoraleae]
MLPKAIVSTNIERRNRTAKRSTDAPKSSRLLDAILPSDRRGQLAALLTDDERLLKAQARTRRGRCGEADHLVDPHPLARPDRDFWRAAAEIHLPLAVRASVRPRQRKSRKAVTGDVLANFSKHARPSVNLILKRRCQKAGLDPVLFSALRSGYLTEAANRGIQLTEPMQQSLHKSGTQAASYYNNAERKNGRAARLIV